MYIKNIEKTKRHNIINGVKEECFLYDWIIVLNSDVRARHGNHVGLQAG